MVISEKEFLGSMSVIFGGIGYVGYIWSIFKERNKPHMFSWIVWTVTETTVFAAQISQIAGPGAWVTGFATAASLVVVGLSIVWGEKNITRGDWISFLAALSAIPLWYFTKNPLGAVIWVTFIDVCGYYPTLRKSLIRPQEESIFLYGAAVLACSASLFAMENFSLVTVLNPIALVVCNGVMVFVLFYCRAALKKS